MYGYAIAQTILSGSGAGATLAAACLALLVFSGILGPFEPRARSLGDRLRTARRRPEPPPEATGERPADPAVTLNPIELALIAEHSLEQASAHDAVASAAGQPPEVRRAAAQAATAWRERARLFKLEARRRNGSPMVPGAPAEVAAPTYAGPERRRQMRRRQNRRGGPDGLSERPDRRDRRDGPERRRTDRRRTELAPR